MATLNNTNAQSPLSPPLDSALQSSVRHIRSEISSPHSLIKSQTVQLTNLHNTVQLLQHTIRALRLSLKLRDIMASTSSIDLSKGAQLYCEILSLVGESELAGIDLIDEEMVLVAEAGSKLRSEAMKVLENGLSELNQAEVGTGLQVFYNMGELRLTVDGLISKYKNQAVKSTSVALDFKVISAGGSGGGAFGPGGVIGSGGIPQIGGGGKAKEAFWQRMATCMDQLHSNIVAVWHLQRVLSKKRDPFKHVLLLDEVMQEGDPLLTDRVWDALVKSFSSHMKSAFTASSFVKEIFTSGYPILFSMIDNFLERISRDTNVKGVFPAITSEGKEQMVASIEIFQNAFLAQCFSRLSDVVNSIFPMSSRGIVATKEHILKIVLRIQEEIEAVELDGHLTLLVLRVIANVLFLIAERAEYQISTGPEARQITGTATPAQVKNCILCQHLQEIHTRMSSMTKGMPTVASDILSPSLGAVYGVACDSVTSLFQAMLDCLESAFCKFTIKILVHMELMLLWTTIHHLTWRTFRSASFIFIVNSYPGYCHLLPMRLPQG